MDTILPTGNLNTPVEPSQTETKKESQKDAVKRLIVDALTAQNLVLDDRVKSLLKSKRSELSKEDKDLVKNIKKHVAQKLIEGFENGTIQFNPEAKTPMKKYAPGLVTNWINKDEFFNVG